jgi:hypothetical protein
MKSLWNTGSLVAIATVALVVANSEFGRPIMESAAEEMPSICRWVKAPAESCLRGQLRALDGIQTRARTVGDALDQRRKDNDADIEQQKRKLQRDSMLVTELRQLRSNNCDSGGCTAGLTWRGRHYPSLADVDLQVDVLQGEQSRIQKTIGNLRKTSADLVTKVKAVADVRIQAIQERIELQNKITLVAADGLARDLQDAVKQVADAVKQAAAFSKEAEQKLDDIEISGAPRIGPDIP